MNVLSLFDGMSCGQIALDQLGIKVDNYYAAEIDKYAIEIAKKNYPNTIHLGDVTKIKGSDLPQIDLLMGGSPCQGFSFAGKQLNFDDPRSALFFEFVRFLKETNPKYFLLENVRMKKEYQNVITEHLGVEPITINSALVSAQNRVRLYWTNIPNITQPEDKGIILKDILNYQNEDYLSEKEMEFMLRSENNKKYVPRIKRARNENQKSNTLTYSMHKGVPYGVIKKPIQVGIADDIKGYDCIKRIYSDEGKSPTLTTMEGGHRQPKVAVYDNEQPHKESTKEKRDNSTEQILATQMGNSLRFDNVVNEHKAMTLRASNPNGIINKKQYYYRKLTPLECERLQTVPDGYTEGVSNTQRYKMLGNGWTVEVIKHIFKNMEV